MSVLPCGPTVLNIECSSEKTPKRTVSRQLAVFQGMLQNDQDSLLSIQGLLVSISWYLGCRSPTPTVGLMTSAGKPERCPASLPLHHPVHPAHESHHLSYWPPPCINLHHVTKAHDSITKPESVGSDNCDAARSHPLTLTSPSA